MRPILYPRFALAASLFVAAAIHADQVDTYVGEQLKKQKAPGLSLAVLRNGRMIKARGYGLASVELNVPATPNTVYQLASVTKQFTAAAILLLVEDGQLQLSDRVTSHLDSLPAAWSNITVRHLLTMTSGIKDYFDHVPANGWSEDYTGERIIGLVAGLPLDFAPGDKFGYSNSNYVLLAMIIHRLSHKPYDAFLAERVFRRLGMSATRRESPTEIITNRATLSDWQNNKLVNVPFLNPTLWDNGDGGLVSTVMDLGKWDAALHANQVLSASTSDALWTLGKFNNGNTQGYGFGWDTGEQRGHRWVGHSGGRPGASTRILRFLDDRLTVIVLMNGPGNAADVALHIAGLYLPRLTLSSIKPSRDPEPELAQRLKQCLFDLATKGDSQMILPKFREECARSKWRLTDFRKYVRDLKSFSYVTSDKASATARDVLTGVNRKCIYKLVNAEETRFCVFELTTDNQVAWCYLVAD